MREIYGRRDFAIIGELVEPKTRVLDLGCGEGELLSWLKEHKDVEGRGVELTGARVQKAIARGVSVYQGDLESAVEDYPDRAFDYVILSQTLQEVRDPLRVLRGMLRVAGGRSSRFRTSGTIRCGCLRFAAAARRRQSCIRMSGGIRPTFTFSPCWISKR